MASCDWKKFKGGTEAKAVFAHCESDERLTREHSNTDINKARTHLNMAFDAFEDGYTGVCKAYDDYIEALDANPKQNKRKDRVTCVGLEIPAPDGMSDDMAREWCVDAYEAVRERLGDTVLGGVAHFDEIHDYRDPETKEVRTSRPHLHIYAVPDIGGRLNAKQYTARRQMVGMNAAIEAMTAAKYPGFKFQNGTKKKSKKSVEALKNDSERAEIIAKAEAEAAKLVEDARQRADRMDAEAAQRLEAAEAAETASKRSLSLVNEKAEGIIEAAQKEAQKASEALQKEREEVQGEREGVERTRQALSAVYVDMLKETEYYNKAQIAYTVAKNKTGLQSAEEYMKTRFVRLKDGTRESIYDAYAREVLKPQEERIARRDAEPEKHAENVRRIKRRLPDLNIRTDDGRQDGGYSK